MTTTPRPWEQTIEEYLDGCSVGGSANRPFSADELRFYADQTDYTHRATSGDYVFDFNHHQSFRITHAPTGEVAGAFAVMMAYVSPEHRGKGLTSRLYVMCADAGISRERVRMLTPASLGAFRKAHAMMVERAVKAGDPVPLRVLSQYKRAEGGGLTLRKPYDRDACNARLDLLVTRKQAARILATTQDASFFPRNPRDADKDAEGVCAYLDGARPRRTAGLRLADAVAREAGGAVRMIVTSYHNGERRRRVHTAFAAVVNGVAIDAFGAGPEGNWPEKLTDLGIIEEQAFWVFSAARTSPRRSGTSGPRRSAWRGCGRKGSPSIVGRSIRDGLGRRSSGTRARRPTPWTRLWATPAHCAPRGR